MAMKQTQTKLFDFSDVGLDFCAGSKNLFPDRFKKMLALGYNEQTVSSVAVAGNQVTLSYGVSHGYVADRVLKVNAPELLSINGGEFVIDSVTENTVTMTIDGAPASIMGNFTTKVASLGWSLEYELGQVHLYKMKYLDERDLYVRLVFTNPSTVNKNIVTVCVGKTADIEAGFITDEHAFEMGKNNTEVYSGFNWLFVTARTSAYDNYTYSQGYSVFGKSLVIGSKYHLNILTSCDSANNSGRTFAILPVSSVGWEKLDFPAVIGQYSTIALGSTSSLDVPQFYAAVDDANSHIMIGKTGVALQGGALTTFYSDYTSRSPAVSNNLEQFNAVVGRPIQLYEVSSKQYLCDIAAGLYSIAYPPGSAPSYSKTVLPQKNLDVASGTSCYLQNTSLVNNATTAAFFLAPVEEVKIV